MTRRAFVPRLVGVVLLIASGLKTYELATGPGTDTSVLSSPWLVAILAVFEFSLGIWLLTSVYAEFSRVAALTCFAAFAAVNLVKGLAGEESCSCLGSLSVSPWYVLGFDLVTLAVLSFESPGYQTCGRVRATVFFAGLAVLITGIVLHAWLGAPGDLYQKVKLDLHAFDFGEQPQGQALTHVFHLSNDLKEPIEVVKATSTCGCTITDGLEGRVIRASESVAIPITLRTGDADGPRAGTITFYYRRLERRVPAHQSVHVRANVVTDYWVRPTLVDFGRVESMQSQRLIRLRPNRLKDVLITHIEVDNPAFVARQVGPLPGTTDLQVELTLSPGQVWQSGPLSANVKLYTTSHRAPTATILVRADVVAPVEVRPSAIVIGSDVRGPVDREIRVTALEPVRIAEVRCLGNAVAITDRPNAASQEHRLRLRLADTAGGLNTEVKFTLEPVTSTLEARTVTVPVHRLPRSERMVAQ